MAVRALTSSNPANAPSTLALNLSDQQNINICQYCTTAQQLLINQYSLRSHLESIDRDYMREHDWTEEQLQAKFANRAGDAHKIQDITVPIIMPQVESALAYYANVFLTGYPIFGVAADPQYEDAALQIETINAENSTSEKWARQLSMFFRDGLKYNLHALEVEWKRKTVFTIQTNISKPNGAEAKTTLWAGNSLRRMDLYNTYFDPRVHPCDIPEKGEFAGYVDIMTRVAFLKYVRDLGVIVPPAVMQKALTSSPAASVTSSMAPFSYYQPIINPFPLMDRINLMGFNWMDWMQGVVSKKQGITYGNVYQVTKQYSRIVPADFGIINVPDANSPQIWKFIVVNGQVVILAERQTNVHDYIPILFGQPIEDGLDFQTKSFASNVSDMQAIATGLMSGYMASKRRLVGDRVLYDPLRVRQKDINSTNPAAKIPVRPSAYGKPVGEAVYAFPYHDEAVHSMLEGSQMMISWADRINGQNPAKQGQFVKGNKTLREYQDVMGHSNDTNQMMAIMTEQQVFITAKDIIKFNILQYQEETTLFNREKSQQVQIKPTDLRQAAIHFKVSDGMLPQDKLMSADAFQATVQAVATPGSPLAGGYNVSQMFTYLQKIQNNIDLSPFEKSQLQLQFEQMQGQWQQIAEAAIKAGQQPPPQPQMPPELIAELQAKSKSGGLNPSPTSKALESTQGGLS